MGEGGRFAGVELLLGSASPRRASLLASLGVVFTVQPVDLDERTLVAGGAEASVTRIAEAKLELLLAVDRPPAVTHLLTADTLVSCDGQVMGKPTSDADAAAMIRAMSGRAIEISTATCVARIAGPSTTSVTRTTVQLVELSEAMTSAYLATGAGMDKAAALALQAEAKPFIADVAGCWTNVVGLPLCSVAAALDLAPRGVAASLRCRADLCGSHQQSPAESD